MKLIDEIQVVASGPGPGRVVSPATQLDFGLGGDGLQNAAIDGLTRRDYVLIGDVYLDQNNPAIEIQLNATPAAHASHGVNAENTVNTTNSPGALAVVSGTMTAPISGRVEIAFGAFDGIIRPYDSRGFIKEDGSDAALDYRLRWYGGTDDNLALVLASIRIICTASRFVTNTLFSLYELQRVF